MVMTDLKPVSTWEINSTDPAIDCGFLKSYLLQRELGEAESIGFAVDDLHTAIAEDAMFVTKNTKLETLGHTAIVDTCALDPNGTGIRTLLLHLAKSKNANFQPPEWKAPKTRKMSFRKIDKLPVLDFYAPYDPAYGIDWDNVEIKKKIIKPELLNYSDDNIMYRLESLLSFATIFVAEMSGESYDEAQNRVNNPQKVVSAFAHFASICVAKYAEIHEIPLAYRNMSFDDKGQETRSFSHFPTGHKLFKNMPRAYISRPVTESASSINTSAISYFISNGMYLFNARGAELLAGYLNNMSI